MRLRRSGSAAGAISGVAVAGVAVATAAIICVLSVFNGFKEVLAVRDDTLTADVTVTPVSGKVIGNVDSLARVLADVDGVELAIPVMADNALAISGGFEMPVDLKGVSLDSYRKVTSLADVILEEGEYPDARRVVNPAAISAGTAAALHIPPAGGEFLLFAPKRRGRLNMANPSASFVMDSVAATGVFRTDRQEVDERTVICDIELARRIFQRDGQGSSVEIKVREGADPADVARAIALRAGDRFEVKDRLMQQEINFRMINIEKWVSFLLLFFILVIASFNIISTLCMVVIEKRRNSATLRALGMSRSRIGAVYGWQSVFVSLAGGLIGITLGVVLCLAQMRWGLIRLPGDPEAMIVSAYPVALDWGDVALTLVPVAAIGIMTAVVASGFARSRL